MVKHEAPWSEYYNSTPTLSPLNGLDVVYSPGQERYLKQAKGAAQQELILIGEM